MWTPAHPSSQRARDLGMTPQEGYGTARGYPISNALKTVRYGDRHLVASCCNRVASMTMAPAIPVIPQFAAAFDLAVHVSAAQTVSVDEWAVRDRSRVTGQLSHTSHRAPTRRSSSS